MFQPLENMELVYNKQKLYFQNDLTIANRAKNRMIIIGNIRVPLAA